MIQKKIDLAFEALKSNNLIKAKKLFEDAISIDPNLPAVYNILGNIELNSGNAQGSIKLFQKAIELNPNFSGAFCNLGLAFKRLKNEKSALENYFQAIDKDPKNFKAYFNLGNLYKEKNDLDNAEKFFIKVVNLVPNMLEAYNNLFELYDKSNQLNKLEDFLNNTKSNLTGEKIIALVVENQKTTLLLDDYLSYGRLKLEEYKIPKEYFIVDKIPRSETGKPLSNLIINIINNKKYVALKK